MELMNETLPLNLTLSNSSIIKVIGVGGGGSNAVNHMYRQGINDVTFIVCNTDNQDLKRSPVPIKIHLGNTTTQGLGAGGKPEVAMAAAEESIEDIKKVLTDNTKMVFITAGMGGGTGTGASPIVAKIARELDILTVGIVTIPFAFEGSKKIQQALRGITELSKYVDALLIINNEKLKLIYPDLNLANAFAKADNVLTNAANAIAEIITIQGYINIDFADVNTIMREGKVAIMNTGYAAGENRITKAIEDALNSPLLNTSDVNGASKVLLSLYCSTSHQILMEEISQIHDFMSRVGDDVTVIWGATYDDELDDKVKITLIATGFNVKDIPGMPITPSANTNVEENNPGTAQASPDENVFLQNEEIENLKNEKNLEKAMKELYGESIKTTPQPEPETITFTVEPSVSDEIVEIIGEEINDNATIITFDDLDDEKILDTVTRTPSWAKKFLKK